MAIGKKTDPLSWSEMGGKGSKALQSDQSQQCDMEAETTITRVENVGVESGAEIEEHESTDVGTQRTRSASFGSRRSFSIEESSIPFGSPAPSFNDGEDTRTDHYLNSSGLDLDLHYLLARFLDEHIFRS